MVSVPNNSWYSGVAKTVSGAPEQLTNSYFASESFNVLGLRASYLLSSSFYLGGVELALGVKNLTNAYQNNFDIKKVASNVGKISSIFVNKDQYHIHYDNHSIIINSDSSILEMGHIEIEDSNIILEEDLIPLKKKKVIEDISISKTITYERIAVDLHSGRLFGSFGVTLIDLVTIGIIILSFTGAYSWIRHKKIF